MSGGDAPGGAPYPAFDVPMYCLDAPSRPLIRPSAQGASQYGTAGSAAGQPFDGEYLSLAVPLKHDSVSGCEFLNWAAMTLVVQPYLKNGAQGLPCGGTGGGGGGRPDVTAADDGGANGAVGVLIRTTGTRATYSGYGQVADGRGSTAAGDAEHASEPMLSAVSLTLLRSPSLGS
jgi:hypothetical protein